MRSAFVVESAFVAVEGVLIGTVLALVTAWSITLTDAFGGDLEFTIPVFAIAVLVVGTLLCTLHRDRRARARRPPRSNPRSRSGSPTEEHDRHGT